MGDGEKVLDGEVMCSCKFCTMGADMSPGEYTTIGGLSVPLEVLLIMALFGRGVVLYRPVYRDVYPPDYPFAGLD